MTKMMNLKRIGGPPKGARQPMPIPLRIYRPFRHLGLCSNERRVKEPPPPPPPPPLLPVNVSACRGRALNMIDSLISGLVLPHGLDLVTLNENKIERLQNLDKTSHSMGTHISVAMGGLRIQNTPFQRVRVLWDQRVTNQGITSRKTAKFPAIFFFKAGEDDS